MSSRILSFRLGDCIELMSEMEANSIGGVITDPPYGIVFMGKKWDDFSTLNIPDLDLTDAQKAQKFHEFWLTQARRILIPGGVCAAFSATRTYHRLMAAYEAVGLLDVSVKAWSYACLSADTEILTEKGWKYGIDLDGSEQVACWDPSDNTISLHVPTRIYKGPFEGELVRFKNKNTDQLLTPNHRVYKKSRIRKQTKGHRVSTLEDQWNVQFASDIPRWNHIWLPLAGIHSGGGLRDPDWAELLGWIWTEGDYDPPGQSGNNTGVRIHQSSVNQEHVDQIRGLLQKLIPTHKEYNRVRLYKDREYTEYTWYLSGEEALWIRSVLPSKSPTWDLLWKMSWEEKQRFLDAALKGDGSVAEFKKAFYQKKQEDLVWMQTLAHVMGMRSILNYDKSVVSLCDRPTLELQGKHLQRYHLYPYKGEVWCVEVPTGAFMAKREDKIFITGNSGFPKSMNIEKALRKLGDDEKADMFKGYGTALKPAWEPIVIGYKSCQMSFPFSE